MIVAERINKLLVKLKEKKFPEQEIEFIKKAIEFAKNKHNGQLRKSGDPYFIHPLETAIFLIDWNMDTDTIIAGIFHDLIEDTETTKEEIEQKFNKRISDLVQVVSKVTEFTKINRQTNKPEDNSKEDIKNKYLIDLILSTTNDIRAIIIKLADRLHNMLTIKFLSENKRKKISLETLNIFANIAGRLGMYWLKTRLLDLSFENIDNKSFLETKQKINEVKEKNSIVWKDTKNRITEIMSANNINVQIEDRIKGIYSTYKKSKIINFEDIHDIYALRLITDDDPLECYKLLGYIHLNFRYIKKTFSDFIANPKFNLYQSIHTTIIINKTLIEIQIRTKKMNDFANFGLAAHWKYKEFNQENEKISNIVQDMILNEIVNDNDQIKQIDLLKLNDENEIFDVFITNKSKTILANKKNTVLDIAYKFDKDNFFNLKSILKNGKKVSFRKTFDKNDTLTFNYCSCENVNPEWLSCTTDEKIKKEIFNKINNKNNELDLNKNDFLQNLNNNLKDKWIGKKETEKLIEEEYQFKNINEFLNFVNHININIWDFQNIFSKSKKEQKKSRSEFSKNLIHWMLNKNGIKNVPSIFFKNILFPKCCNKIYGLDIFGVIKKENLFIHSCTCQSINKHSKEKTIFLEWDKEKLEEEHKLFLYNLKLEIEYSILLINETVFLLDKYNLFINKLIVFDKKNINNTKEIEIELYSENIENINNWLKELKEIKIVKRIL